MRIISVKFAFNWLSGVGDVVWTDGRMTDT